MEILPCPFKLFKLRRLNRRKQSLQGGAARRGGDRAFPLESGKDLVGVAKLLASVNLWPMPGWFFGIFDTSTEPAVVLRKIIWDEVFAGNWSCRWCPVDRGSRINLRLGNDISHPTYPAGCIEPNEFALFDRLLEPGMTVVDIGANDGFTPPWRRQRSARSVG